LQDLGERTLTTRDGNPVWILSTLVPVFQDDDLECILSMNVNITRHMEGMKKLNQKVIELEKFTKLAVNRELKMVELKERIANLEEVARTGNSRTGDRT